MSAPIDVTDVAERKRDWPWMNVPLPVIEPRPKEFTEDYFEWENRNSWRINFSVHKDDLEGAKRLAKQLWNLGKNPKAKEEAQIIQQLMKIRTKDYDKKTEVEKWAHMTVQLPEDWGPVRENKKNLKRMITQRAYGNVLEAMCGFRSYFDESENIVKVIALDFCKEALERYDYPERKRIIYDLKKVIHGERMDFFEDGSFQTIGVFFGVDYLTNPIPIYKEFYRILSQDGKLLIVGGTTQGYKDMLKRTFDPEVCANYMKTAGFSTEIEHLPLKVEIERGEYFLVEGKK